MLKSRLCDLLGIEYPVIQGGMAWIADAELAAATSNAGGLGLIAAMNANADVVREEIRKCKTLTDKPFGVNIMLMSPFADDVAKMVVEENVPVVTTGAGNPGKYVESWKQAGIIVIPVIASVAHARKMERSGVDAVIAEGGESGGHIGEMTTMTLVPQVCNAVSLPVVAAGGIGDGRAMAAALMLGACGVQMGTRFLLADECNVHENYKQRIIKAKDIDTIATGRRLGHPVRGVRNAFMREYLKKEYDSTISDEELEAFGGGSLYRAAVEGDEKTGSFLAGQVAGMLCEKESAANIVHSVCREAEDLLNNATQWIAR